MKLSNQEKYAIQGMLFDGKEIDDIYKAIKKPKKTIDNYINIEWPKIKQVASNAIARDVDEIIEKLDDIRTEAIKQLCKENDSGDDNPVQKETLKSQMALKVNKAMKALGKPQTVQAVLNYIKQHTSYKDVLITQTRDKGNRGVNIMTQGASEKSDDSRKVMKKRDKLGRKARRNVYSISENKILDE